MRTAHTAALLLGFAGTVAAAPDDVATVSADEVRIGGDDKKRYFLLARKNETAAPRRGYRLLVVLPGGDGSDAFRSFAMRILEHGLPAGHVVAQAVAPRWSAAQKIVWPTGKTPVPGQRFTTEEFIEEIVADVRKRRPIDRKHVYCLGWSSSGPALYAAGLRKKTPCAGFFISMSVFRPQWLPGFKAAKGRLFFIDHSPEDKVCPYWMAEKAKDALQRAGARVEFSSYDGGHGWGRDVYRRIARGIEWLESGGREAKSGRR